ncbi:MAG: ABC transporter ATP-binding protein [Verrucomicrobia bacterium]|nr:ABC transporter ATP-binding protein [Verrucomicrobiota bacterium]
MADLLAVHESAISGELTIRVREAVRSFRTGATLTPVLRGFTADFRAGELTLVVGPSGSGKTTALGLLGGLLRPDSGSVHALGQDLTSLSPRELEGFRLRHCGFVFQSFNLFSALTAREQVMLVLQYLGHPPEAVRPDADAALAEVGLSARADLRPQALSGGEKQRVAIARALCKRPRILLADEPTSALDRENGENIAGLLREIAHRRGATVVAVTHDPRLLRHADRILEIEDGRIVRERTSALESL